MRVFITGGSGCVGHYLVRHFMALPDAEITLLLRNPGKLNLSDDERARIEIIEGDLTNAAELLQDHHRFDLAVLAATAWGGKNVFKITVDGNVSLADRLIALGCPRIIYFATASVLGRDLRLLDEARDHGTGYIKAKHKLVAEMEQRAKDAEIIGFFPTVVFGGGEEPVNAPQSHVIRMLFENQRWLPVARRLSAIGKFHLIHPADIATLTGHFAKKELPDGSPRVVLGNEPLCADDLMRDVVEATGKAYRPLFRITENRISGFSKLFRIKMSPWDRYNTEHADQTYPMAVMPGDFGLPTAMPDVPTVLKSVGFPKKTA